MSSRAVMLGVLAWLGATGVSLSARAADSQPILWYRNSGGCPDGAAFLARLAIRGVTAHLAQVGDSIDFVVTLGESPDGARGLLERQTETKTVAIRELDGESCEQVADAIALSLVVANTPRATPDPGATGAAPPPPANSAPVVSRVTDAPSRDESRVAPEHGAPIRWGVGFQSGGMLGVTPEALLASSVFVELMPPNTSRLRSGSLRVGAFEAQSVTSGSGRFSVFVAGGRLEACPVRLESDPVYVAPCGAIDLGTIRTSGEGAQGATDHGPWAALQGGLRAGFRVFPRLDVELQGSVVVPLERYDFVSEGAGRSYPGGEIGWNLAVGASVRFP